MIHMLAEALPGMCTGASKVCGEAPFVPDPSYAWVTWLVVIVIVYAVVAETGLIIKLITHR